MSSAWRSAWVICPTFSASVIRLIRSETRWSTGSAEFRYGSPLASMTTPDGSDGTPASVLESVTSMRSATSAVSSASTLIGNVCTVPEAVPAGKSSVPVAGV